MKYLVAIVAVLSAALVGWSVARRRAAIRRQTRRNQSSLRRVTSKAKTAREVVATSEFAPGDDVYAIFTAKLAVLDRDLADLEEQPLTEPGFGFGNDASTLATSYDRLLALTKLASSVEGAREWPHEHLDELLAERENPGPESKAAPDPPASSHLTRLANKCRKLDDTRPDLVARMADVDVRDTDGVALGEVERIVEELLKEYEQLSQACRRAWNRMFPVRAAERDAAGDQAWAEATQMIEFNQKTRASAEKDRQRWLNVQKPPRGNGPDGTSSDSLF